MQRLSVFCLSVYDDWRLTVVLSRFCHLQFIVSTLPVRLCKTRVLLFHVNRRATVLCECVCVMFCSSELSVHAFWGRYSLLFLIRETCIFQGRYVTVSNHRLQVTIYKKLLREHLNRISAVGIVTRLRAAQTMNCVSISDKSKIYVFVQAIRLALEPTQPPNKWGRRTLSPQDKATRT
jgi:hypothetical protein